MVIKWLGDGLINIARFESYVHILALSFKEYMTISHNPYQAVSLSKLTILVNSEQIRGREWVGIRE